MSRRRRVLALAALAAGGAGLLLGAFERVTVSGPSMLPTLQPGDRLLVRRRRCGRRPPPGAVVVVVDPREPRRRTVKRLAQVADAGAIVLGDNAAASTDSRVWGPVPWRSLRGTVVYRYAPAERAGRLPRTVTPTDGPPPPPPRR